MNEAPDKIRPRPNRQTYLALFVVITMGVLMYRDLTQFEEKGGYYQMNTILVLGYDLFGKWGAIGTWGGISIIFVGLTLFKGDEPPKQS